jgi:hypothetical protein
LATRSVIHSPHGLWSLGIVVLLSGCAAETIVRTKNNRAESVRSSLEAHVLSVEYRNGLVVFFTDGTYGVPLPKTKRWTDRFEVPVGGHFFRRPDAHSTMTLQIAAIGGEAVELTYTSCFNHRSFGKNEITLDRGRVRLKWRRHKDPQSRSQ